MKNHENRLGIVKNQPGRNKQKRHKQTDRQNLPIIYRFEHPETSELYVMIILHRNELGNPLLINVHLNLDFHLWDFIGSEQMHGIQLHEH